MSITDDDRDRAARALWPLARYRWPRDDEMTDEQRQQWERTAAALAAERERAIEPFVALADEMQHQVNFRRETGPDVVADVREVDLQWLRLAISNAREPRQ